MTDEVRKSQSLRRNKLQSPVASAERGAVGAAQHPAAGSTQALPPDALIQRLTRLRLSMLLKQKKKRKETKGRGKNDLPRRSESAPGAEGRGGARPAAGGSCAGSPGGARALQQVAPWRNG